MSSTEIQRRQKEMFVYILEFAERAPGLEVSFLPKIAPPSLSDDDTCFDNESETIAIRQKIDAKTLRIDPKSISGILPRFDQDGEEFIQINFEAGHKILITKNLIGFKPVLLSGLERAGLPNVVTTPDILNVLDAIHDASLEGQKTDEEVKSLKLVFEAVILGGELVGFDLAAERAWLKRFPIVPPKAMA